MINQRDVIYFLFTDRFKDGDPKNDFDVDPSDPTAFHGGDFAGIIEKIPYLKNLGVTAVWITPVYQNIEDTKDPRFRNRAYHGYWPLDFNQVDRHLYSADPKIPDGDMRHLQKLARELHKNDLKLVLDMVVNHTGYEHPWQKERPDWFHPPGYEDDVRRYLFGLPDLNFSNPDVIDYFIDNIIDWVNIGEIDGIRMDAVKHIDKPFWYHLKANLRGACPQISIFGEAFDYDPNLVSHYTNYFDFDSMLDFPLKNAMYEVFAGEAPFYRIARPRLSDNETPGILDMDFKYNNPYRLITFLDNHDMPRFFTVLADHFGRDEEGLALATETYKMAFMFLLVCRGVPQLFYGDEIGMEGWNDPDNRRDMPWSVFKGNKPDAKKSARAKSIFDHLKRVIEVRQANPALQYGSVLTLWVDEYLMVFVRYIEDNVLVCAFNNGRSPMEEAIQVPYGRNANIPLRVRRIMSQKGKIHSELNNSSLEFSKDHFTLRLDGKQGDIFKIN